MNFKTIIIFLLLAVSNNVIAHPLVDSFINSNSCFFIKYGFPMEKITNFDLQYKDINLDSSKVERAYNGYFWKSQCKIFDNDKSSLNEDIIDFKRMEGLICSKKAVGKKKHIIVDRITPYRQGSYTYCYYVFHYGNSNMNIVFKLIDNKVVRFCYYLTIS